jgi:hypothetical protein
MDSNVLIVLILVVGVIAIVVMLRDRITKFRAHTSVTKGEGGVDIEAAKPKQKMSAQPPDPHSVVISGNKNIGRGNAIEVSRDDVAVTANLQLGEDQKIVAEPETGRKKK